MTIWAKGRRAHFGVTGPVVVAVAAEAGVVVVAEDAAAAVAATRAATTRATSRPTPPNLNPDQTKDLVQCVLARETVATALFLANASTTIAKDQS